MVGDAIEDEYIYVQALGKSAKESIVTHKILNSETFKGGVHAAAAHLKTFCKSVDIKTGTGCTRKTRYVEQNYLRKLFEVHSHANGFQSIPVNYEDFDLIIVTDFGHGAISQSMIEEMTLKARYLAVNAQTNSANHGFNLITKYPRADYVVLDELEARLAIRDRECVVDTIPEKLGYKRIVVTLGCYGAIGYENILHKDTGMKDRVLDTMGAGDAFFSVSSLFAAVGADMPTLLKVGNAAGAIKCRTIGHRESVTVEKLVDKLNQFA